MKKCKRWIPFAVGCLCGLVHAILTVEGYHKEAWALEAVLSLAENILAGRRGLFQSR